MLYFCYAARTQIFIDGNKRVTQLIANKVLIENDILNSVIILINPFLLVYIKLIETGLIVFYNVLCGCHSAYKKSVIGQSVIGQFVQKTLLFFVSML